MTLRPNLSQSIIARRPHLYYWRDHLGLKIDGLWEQGEELKSIEIKASSTILDDFFQNIHRWQTIAKQPGKEAFLIYTGDVKMQRKEITILPWNEIIAFPLS